MPAIVTIKILKPKDFDSTQEIARRVIFHGIMPSIIDREKDERSLPLIRPGSIVVLPSGRRFYIRGIGVDRYGMGPYYSGEDVEHPRDGRLELLHCALERFGYQEIIPFGERTVELRAAYAR